MYTKSWQIIKDDSERTFEICGKEANDNSFTNEVYGMQKAGMNVSSLSLPVTNKYSSKESITIAGYTKENGLQTRLRSQYREINRSVDPW
jgi:hypothetical protein